MRYSDMEDQAYQAALGLIDDHVAPDHLARAIIDLASQFMDRVIAHLDLSRELDMLACARGCSTCCHQMVGVTQPELNLIRQAIGQLPKSAQKRVRDRAARTKRLAWGLDAAGWWRAKLACPLLDEGGGCLIHQSRPLPCRAFNSRDRLACVRSLAGDAVQIPMIGAQHGVFGHAQKGLSRALAQRGQCGLAVILGVSL